jgi:L-ascorbate metabolism protein UlaG (beta-lactamase superfamily)
MRRFVSLIVVVAIAGSLLLLRFDACPQPMNILEYFRTFGFFRSSPLRVTFLGASTLLFEDDSEAILIDGFFTRPSLSFPPSATAVTPDSAAIDAALDQLQITTTTQPRTLALTGVVVNHSHYDHAMDSTAVAARTGALLVGSESTANIARGHMFPEERLRVISGGENFCLGRFRVAFVQTGHVPLPFGADNPGNITTPTVPATVGDYKGGGTFAVFVQYRGRGRFMLVQGSAGFAPGALQGRSAAVVYLAVGGLSFPSNATHRDTYWNEVVGAVSPQRVVPIHWDGLTGPLSASTGPSSDGSAGITFAEEHAQAAGIGTQTPTILNKVDPFAGL